MKQFFCLFVGALVAIPAFAIHSYRAELCQSENLKLVYQGNYPVGGSYKLSRIKVPDDAVQIFERDGEYTASENEFVVVREKVLKRHVVKSPCDREDEYVFDENIFATQKVIELTKLSAEDEAQLGVKSGTYMIFNCHENLSIPNRCPRH